MPLQTLPTTLPGVMLFQPAVFPDDRGFFLETFNRKNYAVLGLDRSFPQDNHSFSKRGVLRGLHYQLKHPQGKLLYVVQGEIFDVAADIRQGSPTFGQWFGATLTAENKQQLFVPEGFAHGFCVLSETAHVLYKCTDIFTPGDDYGILWSDPRIHIRWPISAPLLSTKDAQNPTLEQIPKHLLPVYTA